MKKSLIKLFIVFFLFLTVPSCEKAEVPEVPNEQSNVEREISINKPVVLAYFPSWSENWTSPGKNSKMREIPSYVNTIFLAFAFPNMRYTKGSYDIKETGINVPYDGQTFRETTRALKNKGIRVILSLGGETYWQDAYSGAAAKCYDIDYQQIKDFIDDFELAGIDWDYEPAGQISILSEKFHVNKFIEFISKSREIMPKGKYLIAAAPSGVGALGGPGPQPAGIDDPESPYKNANSAEYGVMNSNAAKVNADAATLFGFASSGHFIPVMKAVGDKIDIIAYQGYNCGGADMAGRKVMYDAYSYYANKYGFTVVAGTHVANEPWGPYYIFNYANVGELAEYIYKGGKQSRQGKNDGIMLWEYLANDTNAHTPKNTGIAFCDLSSKILNGKITAEDAKNYNPSEAVSEPYNGGAENPSGGTGGSGSSGEGDGGATGGDGGSSSEKLYCGSLAWDENKEYTEPGAKVYYKSKIWKNAWWTKGDIPGTLWGPWSEVSACAGDEVTDPKPPVTPAPKPPVTVPDPPTNPDPPTPPVDTALHCKYPAWDATKIYDKPGNQVYYEGYIWKNNWWTQNNKPVDEPWKEWTKVIECNE